METYLGTTITECKMQQTECNVMASLFHMIVSTDCQGNIMITIAWSVAICIPD